MFGECGPRAATHSSCFTDELGGCERTATFHCQETRREGRNEAGDLALQVANHSAELPNAADDLASDAGDGATLAI